MKVTDGHGTPEQHGETVDLEDRQRSALPAAAVAGLWYVLAPLGLGLLLLLLVLWFAFGGGFGAASEPQPVEAPATDEPAGASGLDDTAEELEYRGGRPPQP